MLVCFTKRGKCGNMGSAMLDKETTKLLIEETVKGTIDELIINAVDDGELGVAQWLVTKRRLVDDEIDSN
jgi:hypothetical protein